MLRLNILTDEADVWIYILRLEDSKIVRLSPVVTDSFGCQDLRTFLSSSTRHLPSHGLDRIKTGHRLTRLQLETVFETSGTFHRSNSFAKVSLTSLTPLRLLFWEVLLSAPRSRPRHCFKCQDLIQEVFKIRG
jgi:hypothetical protein